MSEEVIVGGYRRVSIIQVGQNSEVWEVTQVGGGQKRFCLKLLLPDKSKDLLHRRSMRREARIALPLQHPRIIQTLKYGTDRRGPHIVMEYFVSQNLKLRKMRGQFEEIIKPHLRKILDQTAQAIAYLHDKRWVHRDVKPDNVLANAQGDVRLIDFALMVRPTGFLSRWLGRRKKTAGTRSYMSPEQIRGQALDHRADIYSFGVMVYELVADQLPFVGTTGAELLHRHLFDPVPKIDTRRGVSPQFEELIGKMLVKDSQRRLGSLHEFLSQMRRIKIFVDEKEPEPSMAGMMGS